jgi:curved DNA-binding protein CbpA
MDPYQTLGVPRDCTREELKEAFREKAQKVHPDRGGEPAAFIQLRSAFDTINDEIDRRPPDPPQAQRGRSRPARTRPPKSPDPNWVPDIVVLDEPLPRTRPARERDPNWTPDLVIGDEPKKSATIPSLRDSARTFQSEMGLLRRFGLTPASKDQSSQSGWNGTAVLALLLAICLTAWICWTAWNYGTQAEPRKARITTFDPARDAE